MFGFKKRKQKEMAILNECLIEMDFVLSSIEDGIATGKTIAINDIPDEYKGIVKGVNNLMALAYASKIEPKKCDCKCQESKKPSPKKVAPKKSVKKPS